MYQKLRNAMYEAVFKALGGRTERKEKGTDECWITDIQKPVIEKKGFMKDG